MPQHTSFAALALALLVPAAGCGSTTADPIGSGGSSSSSSASSTGGQAASSTSGTGGAAPGACAPGCGSAEICVDAACHALVKLDTSTGGQGCTIVLDAAHAYWSTSEVRIVPKVGGQPTSFSAWVGQPSGLWVDDAYLYFNAGNGGIARAKKDGKSGFTPFAGEGSGSPRHLVGDGAMLYYIEQDPAGVYQSPTTQTDPTQAPAVFSSGIYGIGTLAIDATSVYFWGATGLVKADKTTQLQTDLSGAGSLFGTVDDATGIVVDGATVFYSSAPVPGTGGFIARVSSAGGTPAVVVDGSSGFNGVFTADATDLYFMTVSGVMKVAKTGGDPVLVSALNPPSPFATCMAADDTYVYWVDGLDLMQYKK
jgi:hypothetical protein